MQKTITVTPDSTRCSTCMLNDICLPLGMPRNDVAKLDELIKERIRIPKAGALFRLGDKVEAVYGLRSGSIKTLLEDYLGQVKVTGYRSEERRVGHEWYRTCQCRWRSYH